MFSLEHYTGLHYKSQCDGNDFREKTCTVNLIAVWLVHRSVDIAYKVFYVTILINNQSGALDANYAPGRVGRTLWVVRLACLQVRIKNMEQS